MVRNVRRQRLSSLEINAVRRTDLGSGLEKSTVLKEDEKRVMPRKGYIAKREVAPDPVYNSTLVTKFVNSMMWGGKKSTAQGIFYTAMTNLETKGGDEALKLFKKATEN